MSESGGGGRPPGPTRRAAAAAAAGTEDLNGDTVCPGLAEAPATSRRAPPAAIVVPSPRPGPGDADADGDRQGRREACRRPGARARGSGGRGLGCPRAGETGPPPGAPAPRARAHPGALTERSSLPPAGPWPGRRPPPSTRAPRGCRTAPPSTTARGRRRLRAGAASGEGRLGPALRARSQ